MFSTSIHVFDFDFHVFDFDSYVFDFEFPVFDFDFIYSTSNSKLVFDFDCRNIRLRVKYYSSYFCPQRNAIEMDSNVQKCVFVYGKISIIRIVSENFGGIDRKMFVDGGENTVAPCRETQTKSPAFLGFCPSIIEVPYSQIHSSLLRLSCFRLRFIYFRLRISCFRLRCLYIRLQIRN